MAVPQNWPSFKTFQNLLGRIKVRESYTSFKFEVRKTPVEIDLSQSGGDAATNSTPPEASGSPDSKGIVIFYVPVALLVFRRAWSRFEG